MKSRGKRKDSYPLRRSKAYERNLKNFEMLVAYELFQNEVMKLRVRLKIGPKATLEGSPNKNWIEWVEEQNGLIMDTPQFVDQEKRINKAFLGGKMTRRQRDKSVQVLYALAPKQDLSASVDGIIEMFGLPLNYKRAIILYILSGSVGDVPDKNWEPALVSSQNDADRARSLTITIYSKLVKDEVDELNDYVKWIGENTLPQYRDLKNAHISTQIQRALEIRSETKPRSADLAEEYLGSRKAKDKARDIVRELKTHQRQRFQKRGKK